jgi:hypothetical protein
MESEQGRGLGLVEFLVNGRPGDPAIRQSGNQESRVAELPDCQIAPPSAGLPVIGDRCQIGNLQLWSAYAAAPRDQMFTSQWRALCEKLM